METKFNFNSQVCTSKIQSERLLALGLKKETADMCWVNLAIFDCDEDMWCLDFGEFPYEERIPAWSLARLVEMIREDIQLGKESCCLEDLCFSIKDNLYDNIIDAIEWLIKEGYFNKEYLV